MIIYKYKDEVNMFLFGFYLVRHKNFNCSIEIDVIPIFYHLYFYQRFVIGWGQAKINVLNFFLSKDLIFFL